MRIAGLRRWFAAAVAAAVLGGCSSSSPVVPFALSPSVGTGAAAVAEQYVVTFYPIWYTYQQSLHAKVNHLAGPIRMGPAFRFIVAPNVDTLYAASFLELSKEPDVLTLAPTKITFSILLVDAYGDVFDTGIHSSGSYGLVGPGWNGTLPAGAARVAVPMDFAYFIVRADKYSKSGVNQIAQAEAFRKAARLAPLSAYNTDPTTGGTTLLPLAAFAPSFKEKGDRLARTDPIGFLTQLQAAVASSIAPPMNAAEKRISKRFNAVFNAPNRDTAALTAGLRQAVSRIDAGYLSHTDKTHWITFLDAGTTWSYLERASFEKYLQFGNSHATSAYFDAYVDTNGSRLDGSAHSYVLRFPKVKVPQAERFWSVTAYYTDAISLVPNPQGKYNVAQYTPGLQRGRDGSISIYIAPRQPSGVPAANWLPVPRQPFNIMLRVYGPTGAVKAGTYLPPAIRPT